MCQQDKIVDYDLRKIAINSLVSFIQTIQLVLFLRSYSLKRKLVANDTVWMDESFWRFRYLKKVLVVTIVF